MTGLSQQSIPELGLESQAGCSLEFLPGGWGGIHQTHSGFSDRLRATRPPWSENSSATIFFSGWIAFLVVSPEGAQCPWEMLACRLLRPNAPPLLGKSLTHTVVSGL